MTSGYGGVVNFLIRKAGRSMLLLVAVIGGIWLLSKDAGSRRLGAKKPANAATPSAELATR